MVRAGAHAKGSEEFVISFENDYIAGAHPKVLQRLIETNLEPLTGYGNDHYCASAREKIAQACACPDASVHFLVGGTQTNATVIDALLHDYEGVVAADSGHVNTHEAGAIEYTGHKVLTVPQHDGKMRAEDLAALLRAFYQDETHEHMVFPGMAYISHPTEFGTLYSKAELEALAGVCQEYRIPLFLDGARLGYGLASPETDVTLPDIARCCDVFYIGGTKVGALCGEAVVFTKGNAPRHFVTQIKQHGALLAKGRVLGVQFDALFTDGLYDEIGRHAIAMAQRLKEILREAGCEFFMESPTNQQFVVMEDARIEALRKRVAFSFWEKVDETHTAVRFVTNWSTTPEDLETLRELLLA